MAPPGAVLTFKAASPCIMTSVASRRRGPTFNSHEEITLQIRCSVSLGRTRHSTVGVNTVVESARIKSQLDVVLDAKGDEFYLKLC